MTLLWILCIAVLSAALNELPEPCRILKRAQRGEHLAFAVCEGLTDSSGGEKNGRSRAARTQGRAYGTASSPQPEETRWALWVGPGTVKIRRREEARTRRP